MPFADTAKQRILEAIDWDRAGLAPPDASPDAHLHALCEHIRRFHFAG